MSIRTVEPVCQFCKRPLKDIASRYRLVGSDCWSKLSAAEQAEALEWARAERDPFRIPAEAAPSAQALLNRINARRAAAGEGQLCHHEGIAGKCLQCDWEAEPDNASVRVLREVCGDGTRRHPGWSFEERRAERVRVVSARWAHITPWTPPVRPPVPRTAATPPRDRKRRHARPTGQLELL